MIKIGGTDLLEEFDLDEALSKVGETIELCACVHSVKQMSGFAFVSLRTARYVIQSVYSEADCADPLDDIREGCFVKVTAVVKKEERARNGIELTLKTMKANVQAYGGLSSPRFKAPSGLLAGRKPRQQKRCSP